MAERDEEERTGKDWARIIVPRVLRAAFWAFVMGGEVLIPLSFPEIGGQLTQFLPVEQTQFSYLLFIFIGFEVAIQLLRGTIFPYALSMARALISIVFLVLITGGGVMSITLQSMPQIPLPQGMSLVFTINFKAILAVFLLMSLLSIVKNLLQAMDFLSEMAEEPMIPPELP